MPNSEIRRPKEIRIAKSKFLTTSMVSVWVCRNWFAFGFFRLRSLLKATILRQAIDRFCSLAAVCVILLLAGCEKSDSSVNEGAPDSNKVMGDGPAVTTTKSGVEMISLPGGEFL